MCSLLCNLNRNPDGPLVPERVPRGYARRLTGNDTMKLRVNGLVNTPCDYSASFI